MSKKASKRNSIMKKSELKEIIKAIVRECITEKCDSGGGHLAGGKKGGRMFKHIKQGYKGEKSPEDAERIAAATVNKNLGEAGLTSENGEEGEEHDYDEKEEIMLIKVIALIAKKLEAMHSGMEGSDEPVTMDVGVEEPVGEEPGEEPIGGEPAAEEPVGGELVGDEPEEPEEEPLEKPEGEEDNDEPEELEEASYKVVAPRAATDAKEDKARRIQTEPKVNETAYKVQGPSAKTFKDSPQFPKAVNNPKNA